MNVVMESLDLRSLQSHYQAGSLTPADVIQQVYERIAQYNDPAVWIFLSPLEDALARARALQGQSPDTLPLYGVPFAIKDNIDWAGIPTTAGCPAFAYTPARSATVVERLIAAGAIPIGKTNLDQFATGLVGTRTPYGVCRNPFDARYIPGGSSSGSGVAVSAGLVSFALGTDTAGSGRVPAAFTNIVGLKPSLGHLSTRGVVPAVRSLDCVSVFALTCDDAAAVLQVAGGFDAEDPYARPFGISSYGSPAARAIPGLRVGVPEAALNFFGNTEAATRYEEAIAHLKSLGCTPVPIDFTPFAETAPLLYEGAWVAERTAAVGEFIAAYPDQVNPVVSQIIEAGRGYDAIAAYQDSYRLMELKRQTEQQWQSMDLLALPTTGTLYTVAEVEAEPVQLNRNLGLYTNFVNLLDLCALAVPNGFHSNGLPIGITLMAPAWRESLLCQLGAAFQARLNLPLGATRQPLPPSAPCQPPLASPEPRIRVAVVGAHLTGQPLNYQLIEEAATLVRACRTQAIYKMYALPGSLAKPGLIRQADGGGSALEVEVWELPAAGFGRFVALIPPPLGIGTLVLEDDESVKGFICEPYATLDAPDISHFGGWRAYLASLETG